MSAINMFVFLERTKKMKSLKQESQNNQILLWMLGGREITDRIAAKKFDCYRLGARICELRMRGHIIDDAAENMPKIKFCCYYIARKNMELSKKIEGIK